MLICGCLGEALEINTGLGIVRKVCVTEAAKEVYPGIWLIALQPERLIKISNGLGVLFLGKIGLATSPIGGGKVFVESNSLVKIVDGLWVTAVFQMRLSCLVVMLGAAGGQRD